MARHGYGHTIPPHLVNYRANLWALQSQGVEDVVSVASVGGIRSDLEPGVIAVPHQIIDYTWGRRCTFYEGQDKAVVHIDFTHPYCQRLREHKKLNFAARPREWGAKVQGTALVQHEGRAYLECKIERRLETLKRLRDKGLITEEEYQHKRKEILQLL